jgi:hypothetical protein
MDKKSIAVKNSQTTVVTKSATLALGMQQGGYVIACDINSFGGYTVVKASLKVDSLGKVFVGVGVARRSPSEKKDNKTLAFNIASGRAITALRRMFEGRKLRNNPLMNGYVFEVREEKTVKNKKGKK